MIKYKQRGITNMNNYCLAMYDVRGKQNYIFRNNHLKEIVGASAMIRDVFSDFLYEEAIRYKNGYDDSFSIESMDTVIYNLSNKKDESVQIEEFNRDKFVSHMDNGFLGELIYDGGGNLFVLYKNEDVAKGITKLFSKRVIKETETMKVLCTYIVDVDFNDYKGDRDKLYKKHMLADINNHFEVPSQILPISQVDNITSMPLSERINTGNNEEKVSYESYAKYRKYYSLKSTGKDNVDLFEGEKFLDNLVEKKGEESLLAIVYIDGNNMGFKFSNCIKDKSSYEDCIKELRLLSSSVQRDCIEKGIAAINDALDKKYKEKGDFRNERRLVVFAGDEINLILNARDALEAVKAYFDSIKNSDSKSSCCAGISIFHSHAPYADAYRIAEECCESGKTRMKELGLEEAFYLDFEYNQGAIGLNLDSIREEDGTELLSKPWIYKDEKNTGDISLELIEKEVSLLNKVARSNVKTLVKAAKTSQNDFDMEIERIKAHSSKEIDFLLDNKIKNNSDLRKIIYDIGIVFDIWFKGEQQ